MDHVIQQRMVFRRKPSFTSMSVVIAVHVAIGAALLLTVRDKIVRPQHPPPVQVWPLEPPKPVVPTRETSRITPTVNRSTSPTLTTPMPTPAEQTVETPSTPSLTNISDQAEPPPGSPAGSESVTGSTPQATPRTDVSVACPNVRTVQAEMRYPVQARRDGVQGDVIVQFVLTASGVVRDARVVSSTHILLNRAALNAVQQFQCIGQGRDLMVEAPFSFRLGE